MLVQLQKNWPADTPPSQPPAEAESGLLSVANLLAILRRRALLIGAAVAAMLVVGVLYLATTKPMFGSTALVYLDIENAQLMDGNSANASGMPATLDDVDVNSQLQIIRSEKIALQRHRATRSQGRQGVHPAAERHRRACLDAGLAFSVR